MSKQGPMLNKEDLQTWLHNPVTVALFEVLAGWREEEKEKWATGTLITTDHFATAVKEAEAIGRCQTCNDILTMTYEGFIQELGYDAVSSSEQ